MTLVAAWIADDFKLIVSDSKSTFPGGYINFGCQKIFTSNEIAVGVYGALSDANMKKIDNYLKENSGFQKNQFIEILPTVYNSQYQEVNLYQTQFLNMYYFDSLTYSYDI